MADEPDGGEPDGYDYDTKQTGFRTFNGETVKSQGERMIADFLYLNGVKYEYERPYGMTSPTPTTRSTAPTSTTPTSTCGTSTGRSTARQPARRVQGLRGPAWPGNSELHRQHGTTLIETTWAEIIDQNGFETARSESSTRHGLSSTGTRTGRSAGANRSSTRTLPASIRTFMTHVKSNSWTRDDLDRRLEAAPAKSTASGARLFLDLYWEIHDEWQRRLAADDASTSRTCSCRQRTTSKPARRHGPTT